MKIILCEDEVQQQEWMRETILEWQRHTQTAVELFIYSSGEELFFKKEEWVDADTIILDIELKDMNGMEIAKEIRRTDANVKLFFVTGYEKYVFEGYEVGAVSYIMKPIDKAKLFQTLDKVKSMCKEAEQYLLIEESIQTKRIYLKDVMYIESMGHYCKIVTTHETIQVRERISDLIEKTAEGKFFACHRSYHVNMAYVRRITKKDIILDDETVIPIARGKWEGVNKAFIGYYKVH